jgi:vacuolar protein 8
MDARTLLAQLQRSGQAATQHTCAAMTTLRNLSAASPDRLAWGEAIRHAGLIPHLVRWVRTAAEETTAAAEAAAAANLFSLCQAAQAALPSPRTPVEAAANLSSLCQAVAALNKQTTAEAAAGTLSSGLSHSASSEPMAAAAAGALSEEEGKEDGDEGSKGEVAAAATRGEMRVEESPALVAAAEAAGALANLAAVSSANQTAAVAAGAAPPLVALLSTADKASELAAEAARALDNLACAHPANQAAIVAAGAIPRLVALLRCGADTEAFRRAFAALRNLGHEQASATLPLPPGVFGPSPARVQLFAVLPWSIRPLAPRITPIALLTAPRRRCATR